MCGHDVATHHCGDSDFSPHPKSWILKLFPVPELKQMQGLAQESSGGSSNCSGQSLTAVEQLK